MVGILTFHKAINYGAVLQAYALRTAVEAMGKPCAVVNYVGEKMHAESRPMYIARCGSVVDQLLYYYRLPMRAATVKKFEQFCRTSLNLSHEEVIGEDALRALPETWDAFITGSDQVFNYDGTGEDFNYYLEFAKGQAKKIAYAPSFGLSTVDQVHAPRVTDALQSFDALSVREELGAQIVEDLIGKRPVQVCDPTFLISKQQWEQLCIPPKHKKPYVLTYTFGSRHLEAVAKELAEQIGGIVVNINRSLPGIVGGKNVKNAYAPGPQEFLGLIKNAEIVLTNSFHGTALSVLLEKEFYVFTNHYSNSGATNNRFETLAKKLGVTDRVYHSIGSVQRSAVDYSAVRKKISSWREESLSFLSNALQK